MIDSFLERVSGRVGNVSRLLPRTKGTCGAGSVIPSPGNPIHGPAPRPHSRRHGAEVEPADENVSDATVALAAFRRLGSLHRVSALVKLVSVLSLQRATFLRVW